MRFGTLATSEIRVDNHDPAFDLRVRFTVCAPAREKAGSSQTLRDWHRLERLSVSRKEREGERERRGEETKEAIAIRALRNAEKPPPLGRLG